VRVSQPVSLIDLFSTVLGQTENRSGLPYALPGVVLTACAADPGYVLKCNIFVGNSRASNPDMVAVNDEERCKLAADMAATPESAATEASIGLRDTRADPTGQADVRAALHLRAAYDE
jgi:hypothetical protein